MGKKAKKTKAKTGSSRKSEAPGSVIPADIRERYKKSNIKTASGARSISCGDEVAQALNGLGLDALEKVARRADLGDRWAKWKTLNPGMVRMNMGNVFRAAIKKGDASAKAALAEAGRMDRSHMIPAKAKKPKAKKVAPVAAPAETVA